MEDIMNKRLVIFLICLALSVGLVTWLTSLDTKDGGTKTEATVSEAPAEPVSSSPDQTPEETAIPLEPVSNAKLKEYQENAEAAMETVREIFLDADKGTASNVVLLDDTVAQMISTLGANGYTAVDYFGNMNVQNAQPLIDFGNAVNAGIDGEACYYVVHNDSTLHANNLLYKNGVASVTTVSVEWDENNRPNVYSTGQYALTRLELTSKGWLICTRESGSTGSDWAVNGNAYTFLRLTAYDDTKRQLANKYMGDQPYLENNLFTCSWSTSDFGQLDFNSLFPLLYSRYYGTVPLTGSNMGYISGFEKLPDTDLYIVPYEQFQKVICSYIDVDIDTLQWLSDDNSSYGGYYVLGTAQEYYNNMTPKTPSPEVTDYWYNSDGSLTLKVDAVYPAYGTDCAFTHELTVMETEDGFKYLSNYVYNSENNIFPEMVLRSERKNQIAEVE